MQKILIIGNSPRVLTQKFGKIIDTEFDEVVRVNRFKTDGFEKFIGERVDTWSLSDEWVYDYMDKPYNLTQRDIKNINKLIISTPGFKYEYVTDNLKLDFQAFNKSLPSVVIKKNVEERINSILDINMSPDGPWATTGLLTIQWAIDNYDDVYIHGFDCYFTHENMHYFEDNRKSDRVFTGKEHDPEKEKYYLDLLIKTGQIKTIENEYSI